MTRSLLDSSSNVSLVLNKCPICDQIRVSAPAQWLKTPVDVKLAAGGDVDVECEATGHPKPQITWKRMTGQTQEPGLLLTLTSVLIDRRLGVEDTAIIVREVGVEEHGKERQWDIWLLGGKWDRESTGLSVQSPHHGYDWDFRERGVLSVAVRVRRWLCLLSQRVRFLTPGHNVSFSAGFALLSDGMVFC